MTDIIQATSVKDLPNSYRGYFIGKNLNGEVEQAIKLFEAKHGVAGRCVVYKQYLMIEVEEISNDPK